MIRSFGLHWSADRVFWGHQGVQGTLLGAASRSRAARAIDFRYQRGIYALYADFELVYLGQTGSGNDRLLKRLKDHKKDHLTERWNRFSWFGTQWVTTSGELSADTKRPKTESMAIALNVLEAVSIAVSEPRLNLQRGKWGEATQYYQWWERPEEAYDDDEE